MSSVISYCRNILSTARAAKTTDSRSGDSKLHTGGLRSRRRGLNGRNRRRRGAEILEAALVAVPLFGLTFLALDVSMVVFLRSTLQHAVREGVRFGVTGYTSGPSVCQDDAIKAVVKANAIGFLNSTSAASTIHVHYMSPVDGSVVDNSPGNILQVSVEGYKYGPLAPFQRTGSPMIWARAYDVIEPYPGALPCITNKE